MNTSLHSCGYFRKQSCGFGVVREIFDSRKVTSMCFRAKKGDILVIFKR